MLIIRICREICRDLHDKGYLFPILLIVAGFTDMIVGSMIIDPNSEYYMINVGIGGAAFFGGGMSLIGVDQYRRTKRRQRLLTATSDQEQAPSEPAPPALAPSAASTPSANATPPSYEPPQPPIDAILPSSKAN